MNIHRPEWQQQAACRGMDPNLFMPKRGDYQGVKRAINICHSCPVIQQCRDYSFQLDEDGLTFGIFGGLTQHGRREAFKEERRTGKPSAARTVTPGLSANGNRKAS